MRHISLLIFIIFSTTLISETNAQSRETQKLIKQVKQVIKIKSIFTEHVDWRTLNNDLKSIAYTDNHNIDKEKVYVVFTNALKKAGDNHSLFVSERVSSEIKDSQNDSIYTKSKYLGGNIGYLKIPYCFTFDYQKDLIFADTIINQIEELDKYEIRKWIIDLRNNRGGNVWPMLSGLTPITGDGLINYSIGNKDEKANFIKQGNIAFTKASTSIYNTKLKFEKLAVLVNRHTASSGEMLAISLLGFENTKSFGYKTNGLTTVNSTFNFRDGTVLFLATGFMADKNKKIYRDGITPDLNFENNVSNETILSKVMEWLNE